MNGTNHTQGLLLLGLCAGMLGGMFGIGGGAVMVPAMVLLMGFEQRFAVGTSLAALLLPVGILGVLVYAREGTMGWKEAGFIASGLVVGNLIGALFANQTWVPPQAMRVAYGILLVATGIRYMFPAKA